MLYYIFDYLDKNYDFPGAGLFQFLSFRGALAVITSFLLSLFVGKITIRTLCKLQIGESIRDLGLQGQIEKKGTPTMGGLIIILATIIPVILFTKIHNIYIILLIVTMLWMGVIGFLDDYIKVFKKNKAGLQGKFKIIGQVCLGIIVAVSLYTHSEVTIKQKLNDADLVQSQDSQVDRNFSDEEKSLKTTIPFFKNNELNYSNALSSILGDYSKYAWLLFIPVVIFIITAVSNGANLTDGLDGLAAGSSAIIVLILGVFAWISGNIIFSDYLNIMYIPRVGEVSVFIAAFAGALIGFLWYNTYPAQVFMGDTGSLTIGGVIAVIAIIVRKELLLPIICGVFMIETLSVIFQVSYFKYTKKKLGEGHRILLMSPLHHHYQKKGIHESKIVSRFWIIGVVLAVIAIITLKIR